ncbi:Creatine kinase M-type [Dissostichus eleginoides]|uniref:creatine kinase n=1 Tax=Dissostichus eleginoides TaxID=100907 RepID=A0AAD9B4T4_DISEL|nr:Creatine kinase M-type [Dissostichus eleginoides]
MHNQLKMKFSSEQEYPDLSQHNNHMAKVLTPDLYESLRDKETPSGFTLDDLIQTGVDNPGTETPQDPPRPPQDP